MKVLIIGSKGFIGSHITTFFELRGHNVWSCDIVNDYNSKKYFQIDATNSDYHTLFERNQFDVCINCSGAASVPLSLKFPLKDYILNTVNVFKLLDAIRSYQPKCKFINLSSAAVYGNPQTLPIVETQPINPVSPYGLHKLQAEQTCKEFEVHFGLQVCNLRIFSAYGEGLRKQLFWDLYKKLEGENLIELYGTGNESRDFIYVSDLANIIHLVASQKEFKYSVLNVGNGKELYIKDVVKIFYNLTNKQIEYMFRGERREGDPINWVADISRLRELGYKQEVLIKDGLESYIKWVKIELRSE